MRAMAQSTVIDLTLLDIQSKNVIKVVMKIILLFSFLRRSCTSHNYCIKYIVIIR